MKISTNFSRPAGWTAPYLAGASSLLALASVIATIALMVSGYELRAGNPEREEQLAHLRERNVETPKDMPPRERLSALRNQVQALNTLTGTVGPALPQLLARLEKQMPNEAWLVSLQHRPGEGEVRLVVEADRSEQLTEFLERLEQSHDFTQVLLTRQSQRNEGARRTIQFEIQLRGKP